jgi:drug/metabolite transporter (DMT)-like permease
MNFWGVLAGLSAAAIWGGMYVASKYVLAVIPPFTLLSLRLILGIFVLLPVVALRRETGFSGKQVYEILGVGLVGYGISLGFQFVGTKLSTAANGSLVTSATPAFVLVFASWILGERVTKWRVVALVVSTLGVLAFLDPRNARLSPDLFWGNLSLIAAALTWALYSVLVRKVTRGLDVLPVSLVAFFGGLPITIPAAFIEVSTQGIGYISIGAILSVLYIGIVSTALAMYLWNLAFAQLEAGLASLTFFAQPVVGAGLGALLLGEDLPPLFLVGGILIGLGLVLAARGDRVGESIT